MGKREDMEGEGAAWEEDNKEEADGVASRFMLLRRPLIAIFTLILCLDLAGVAGVEPSHSWIPFYRMVTVFLLLCAQILQTGFITFVVKAEE